MTTDPVFYRLFETSPETFFLVLGMPLELARDMATRYEYQALEFKETSHRTDGVFRPKEHGLPIYFLEVQFYPLASVYADVLAKVFTYLKQHDPTQPFCAVVLFGTRALEPKGLLPYQALIDAVQLRRLYLDEMPEVAHAPLGLAILGLIGQPEAQAPTTARDLVARTRSEIQDEALRNNLVELIETIVIYKLPLLSREEIQTMLQVHDIRESRVYQEAKEEGLKEGEEKGKEKGLKEGKEKGLKEGKEEERQRSWQEKQQSILKLAARQMPVADIAEVLGLDVELVKKSLAKRP